MTKKGYMGITLDEYTFKQIEKIRKQGNFKTTPETIRAMVHSWKSTDKAEINRKIKLLLRLVDYDQAPFTYFLLEQNITEEEEEAIYDLMDNTSKLIQSGYKVDHVHFEERIYNIFPRFKGDYHIPEIIVKTLKKEGRWLEVYKCLKKDGMNI